MIFDKETNKPQQTTDGIIVLNLKIKNEQIKNNNLHYQPFIQHLFNNNKCYFRF